MLVLRTCNADLTSHGRFKWPASGPVSAPDWNGQPDCGGGLHGLPWGEGDGELLNWDESSKWLVVEVADTCLCFERKCKFPRGIVVYSGDRLGATAYLAANGGFGRAIVGGLITAGDGGTATAGDRGTLIIRRWDYSADRWRISIGYIGEDGLLAGVKYRLTDAGRFELVTEGAV